MNPLRRRGFLGTALAAGVAIRRAAGEPFPLEPELAFALLGDTHFDRLAHHDFEWLKREHPRDVAQVERYSQHTARLLPALFDAVGRRLRSLGSSAHGVVHVGDFVEGLCGSQPLAERHVAEACEFVAAERWNVPFWLTKGNHDRTGPGAEEAFAKIVLPFLSRQSGASPAAANYVVERPAARFAFFDAYDSRSLPWLKETLGRNGSRRPTFVVVHPPIVPFQARGNWSLFLRDGDETKRRELLELLGEHRAIVLCGHVHRYGVVVRRTERGPFMQLCVSSILSGDAQRPRQSLAGLAAYGPELTELEPSFQPETKELRRRQFAAEKPHLTHFEYADTAGYAVLRIAAERVTASIYNGAADEPWKELDLTALRDTSA